MGNQSLGMSIGWLFGLLFLAVFIGLLIRGLCARRRYWRIPRGDEALEILKTRYAKGEIGDEEFEHRQAELRSENQRLNGK